MVEIPIILLLILINAILAGTEIAVLSSRRPLRSEIAALDIDEPAVTIRKRV